MQLAVTERREYEITSGQGDAKGRQLHQAKPKVRRSGIRAAHTIWTRMRQPLTPRPATRELRRSTGVRMQDLTSGMLAAGRTGLFHLMLEG